MVPACLIDKMSLRVFLLIWAIALRATLAEICYMGNEPDKSGKMRWVLPYRDPCSCTEIRPGGFNLQAPERLFLPRYLNSSQVMSIITDDPKKIRELLGCTSDPPVRMMVCEKSQLNIACDSNKVIDVQWSLYGRESGSLDCMGGWGPPQAGTCVNETVSLGKVKARCQGEQSCTFMVNNNFFDGDPCSGTAKYLLVDYACEYV